MNDESIESSSVHPETFYHILPHFSFYSEINNIGLLGMEKYLVWKNLL